MMIIKYLLSKSQENNLHFNMTNNTVVHEWTKNENRGGFHAQTVDYAESSRVLLNCQLYTNSKSKRLMSTKDYPQ